MFKRSAPAQAGTLLSNGDDLARIMRAEEGFVSRRIFADAEVYNLELQRIFARAPWFFLAHESEIRTQAIWSPALAASIQLWSCATMRAWCAPFSTRAAIAACACAHRQGQRPLFALPLTWWAYRTDGSLVSVPAESHYGPGRT